jgi:MraZ protein
LWSESGWFEWLGAAGEGDMPEEMLSLSL